MINSYTGYKEFNYTEEQLANFYNNKNCLLDELKENQYGILKFDGKVIEKVKRIDNNILVIPFQIINTKFSGKIKPRNLEQEMAIDLLSERKVPVKLITGTFGSGKSLLCINAALSAIERGEFEKIVFIRNNIQVKDTDNLGALPGLF